MRLVASSAIEVCRFVDGLDRDAAGELFVIGLDGARAGAVFVEGGRICWAAARGLARRLGDLLAASANLEPAAMEALYATCQRERLPLGEHLVSRGLVTASALRAALLEHATASLHHLCGANAVQAEWRARSFGYSSRFTFSTGEVLARTLALAHEPAASRVARELAESFPEGEWGAAFVRSATRAAPDPIAVHGWHPNVEDLARLGQWATASLDVAGALDDPSVFFTTAVERGAFSAWTSGAVVVAGFSGARGPARLLHRRARARRGVTA